MGGGRRVGLEPETHTGCGFCARGRRPSADRLWDLAVALVCPDKFRGTLSAAGAAEALARGLEAAEVDRRRFDEVRRLPLADGGEGAAGAVTPPSLGAAGVLGPQRGPPRAGVALLPRRGGRRAGVSGRGGGVDGAPLTPAGAAGGLAGGLAARGARLEPGFEVVARAA